MFVLEVRPEIIKDSRGEKTIQISLWTYEGKFVSSAPSGKSRGKNEVEPYNILGIEKSLVLLKEFCPKLKNQNFMIRKVDDLRKLVEVVKKFENNWGKFGGNVTYCLESVFLKAAARDVGKELWQFINDDVNQGKKPQMPTPIGNVIGGGLHSKEINGLRPDFQEFVLIPEGKTFSENVSLNLKAYTLAQKLIGTSKTNDENAWMTNKSNEEVLEILYNVGKHFNIRIGMDIAASTFFKRGYYYYLNKELIRDKVDQSDYMARLIKKYNLFYLEDPMHEEDFSGFKEILEFVKENKFKTLVVGDDLTTTNIRQVRRAVEGGVINAVIVKPNQIGSLIEVKNVVDYCKKNKIFTVFSHRSGETMDDGLADFCVGFGGDFIKTGVFGKERLIKLKRIMDIEKNFQWK